MIEQNNSEIRRVPFSTIRKIHKNRALRDAALNNTAPIRLAANAVPALAALMQAQLAAVCDKVYPIARAAGRNTVYAKDIELYLRLSNENKA